MAIICTCLTWGAKILLNKIISLEMDNWGRLEGFISLRGLPSFLRKPSPRYPFFTAHKVINPEVKLILKVAISLQTDKFHPIVAVLKKKISGSMEGEAIQNDITGASGTPLINKEAITGITPQEQKGLMAPIRVANTMEIQGLLLKMLPMYFDKLENCMPTASGIVISKYGQMWINE